MRNYMMGAFGAICLVSLVLSSLAACGGGGGGTPGSGGSEETNVVFTATVTPPNISNTPNIGANCNGVAFADVVVTTQKLFPEIAAGIQTIEKYNVDFFTVTQGAPPIEGLEIFQTYHVTVSNSIDFKDFKAHLVDVARKEKYLSDVTSGRYPIGEDDFPFYTARYTFSGQDDEGGEFQFQAQTTFTIGKDPACELEVEEPPIANAAAR